MRSFFVHSDLADACILLMHMNEQDMNRIVLQVAHMPVSKLCLEASK